MTFFPNFRLWCQICTVASIIKPAIAPHRPAFDEKNVGGAINFVSWKFVIQCPDFCFSKYGNPNYTTVTFNKNKIELRLTSISFSRYYRMSVNSEYCWLVQILLTEKLMCALQIFHFQNILPLSQHHCSFSSFVFHCTDCHCLTSKLSLS